MRNPLYRLKFLPWRSLIQVAALTTLVVVVLDTMLVLGAIQSTVIARILTVLFSPALGILTLLAAAIGVGALAVFIFEQINGAAVNTNSLWGLILCLLVAFLLKRLLPLPALLIQFDQLQLVGLVLGVFFKGRPYWRSFQRW